MIFLFWSLDDATLIKIELYYYAFSHFAFHHRWNKESLLFNNKINKLSISRLAIMTSDVRDDKFRQAILASIADKEMAKIMECATLKAKSVNQVIRETGISYSTAYRKIKWMVDEGLLFTEKFEITPDGKKFSLFKSTLKSINVKYESGKTTVQVEYNVNVLQRTAERLFSLGPD